MKRVRRVLPYLTVILAYAVARTILALASTTSSPIGPESSDTVLALTGLALLLRFLVFFVALPMAISKIVTLFILRSP